jgi:hypothetical protein
MPTAAPYLFKEHREEKKGEKILVPVRFSECRPEDRDQKERQEQVLARVLTTGEQETRSFALTTKASM